MRPPICLPVLCLVLILNLQPFFEILHPRLHASEWSTYRANAQRTAFLPQVLPEKLSLQWTHQTKPPTPAWPGPARQSYWQQLPSIQPRVTDDHHLPIILSPTHAYFSSPGSHTIQAIDLQSGHLKWSFHADGPIRYAPLLATHHLFFASDDGSLYCLHPENGTLLWKTPLYPEDRRIMGNGSLISAWPARTGPVLADNTLYIASGLYPSQGTYAFALEPQTGRILWRTPLDVSPQGYLLTSPDTLYIPTGRGNPIALDRTTGQKKQTYSGVGGSFVVVTEQDLIAGPGNSNDLQLSDSVSASRLIQFQGIDLSVTPDRSYLLKTNSVVALDRLLYSQLQRQLQQLQTKLRDLPRSAELEKLALSETLLHTQNSLQQCVLWETPLPIQHPHALVSCQNLVFASGDDSLFALSSQDGSVLWSQGLPGQPTSLSLNPDSLLATSTQGHIWKFSSGSPHSSTPSLTAPVKTSPPSPPHPIRLRLPWLTTALSPFNLPSKGVCIVLGLSNGDLLQDLLLRGEWTLAGFDPDPALVQRLRDRFEQQGLYGSRISLHVLTPETNSLPLTDYLANLVLSESGLLDGQPPLWSQKELHRILRPYGGLLWVDRKQKPFVRNDLSGAGAWTHQYGNPGNTANSGDTLIRSDLRLQWFGGPGPGIMVDRHLRGPAPLASNGLLWIPGENQILGVDAYNGTELWSQVLPSSQRYSMPYDAGYFSADGTTLAVAVRHQCWLLDGYTGNILSRYNLPDEAWDSKQTHWGYTVLENKILYGTKQHATASRTQPSREQIDLDYRNSQPLVTSSTLFALSSETHQTLWTYSPGLMINSTITLGQKRIALIEISLPLQGAEKGGRHPLTELLQHPASLTCLDKQTGKTLWKRALPPSLLQSQNILHLTGNSHTLAAVGSRLDDTNDTQYLVACWDWETGNLLWEGQHQKGMPNANYHGEQVHHPVLLDQYLIAEPVIYHLPSGRLIQETDSTLPWTLKRPGHSCGTLSAAGTCLFFRANNPTLLDLGTGMNQKSFQTLAPTRPGCWINIIPANGLVLIPEASAGCVCHYSLQTSMAFLPLASSGEALP